MNKQTDIIGWSSTVWGMTEEEILKLVPDAKRPNPPILIYINPERFSTVGIPGKNIEGRSCNIRFLFDEKTGLNQVRIDPNQEGNPHGYFEFFLELLTEKYGPTTKITNNNDDLSGNINDNIIWLFPTTTVDLQRTIAPALDFLSTSIIYNKTMPRDLSLL